MKITELVKLTGLKEIVLADGEREVLGVYIGDLLSWVMGRASYGNAWITIMSNINTIAVATLADVSTIILAEGVTLDNEVLAVAKAKGVNVLSSDKSAYELAIDISKHLS